jgi:hypothetical protein
MSIPGPEGVWMKIRNGAPIKVGVVEHSKDGQWREGFSAIGITTNSSVQIMVSQGKWDIWESEWKKVG